MPVYIKANTNRVTYGLTLKEFRCKCVYESCTGTVISKALIEAYGTFRREIDKSLTILCGFRCSLHNFNTQNSSLKSRHMAGDAIDISLHNLSEFFTNEQLKKIALRCGFTYVKFYSNFMHLDVR